MEQLSVVDGKLQGLKKTRLDLETLKYTDLGNTEIQTHLAGQLHQPVHVWFESSKVLTHADQVQVMDDH